MSRPNVEDKFSTFSLVLLAILLQHARSTVQCSMLSLTKLQHCFSNELKAKNQQKRNK